MKRFKKLSVVLVVMVLVFSLIACSPKTTDESDKDLGQVQEDDTQNDDVDSEEDLEEPLDEDTDPLDLMIESSDYISKIKLIKKGEDSKEIKILDNIKNPLSSTELPALENLEENRAYIVFMKDLDGKVVLTDEENGVILLEGDNHELFDKIHQQLHNH